MCTILLLQIINKTHTCQETSKYAVHCNQNCFYSSVLSFFHSLELYKLVQKTVLETTRNLFKSQPIIISTSTDISMQIRLILGFSLHFNLYCIVIPYLRQFNPIAIGLNEE